MAQKDRRVSLDDLEETPKKKKKFNLFDAFYTRREPKNDIDPVWHERNFKYFFPFCLHNFSRIFYVNLLFIFGNFPIFIIMLALSENLHMHATLPASPLYAPVYGAAKIGALSPVSAAFSGIYGVTTDVALWTTAAKVVLIAGAILLLITFGPVMTGCTYILRNVVKGEPIFLIHDFFYAIRRNLKQCFVLGILDIFFVFLLIYDVYFFWLNPQIPFSGAFIVISLFVLIVYFIMRFYTYVMMITFDLSLFKIFKNAFIFTLAGLGRNALALLGIALSVFLNYGIMALYLPLGALLPFMITIALCMFIYTYAAWPKIKKVMIDPYYDDNGSPIGTAPDGHEDSGDGGDDFSGGDPEALPEGN